MSLANLLTEAGHPARELRTTAEVTLAAVGGAYDITRIALRTEGEVPGIDGEVFADIARQAKNCTISRALAGTEITLEAHLAAS
jgi:lipoyl-dependent peroxiredoxin